jgi:hypothetical protein
MIVLAFAGGGGLLVALIGFVGTVVAAFILRGKKGG